MSASDLAKGKKAKITKTESAIEVSKVLLGLLAKKKITSLVFDRSYYKYHGRIKSLADGAREGGLKF